MLQLPSNDGQFSAKMMTCIIETNEKLTFKVLYHHFVAQALANDTVCTRSS